MLAPAKQEGHASKQDPLLELPKLRRVAARKLLRRATKQLLPRFTGPEQLAAADSAGLVVDATDLIKGVKSEY